MALRSALPRIEPVAIGRLSGRNTTLPLRQTTQFDVNKADWHQYKSSWLGSSLWVRILGHAVLDAPSPTSSRTYSDYLQSTVASLYQIQAFTADHLLSVSLFCFETMESECMIQNLKSPQQRNSMCPISNHPLSWTEAYLGG